MKKKRGFLAILLCFCMLLVAGCFDGGLNDFGGDNSFGEVLSMDGVKVLSKPTDYNFSGAIGENNSVNYYNKFANNIMRDLYNVYEKHDDPTIWVGDGDVHKNTIFSNDIDKDHGETFENFTNEFDNYYLYDSLRFTIQEVNQTSDGDLNNDIQVTLKNNSWIWSIPYNAANKKIVFEQIVEPEVENGSLNYSFQSQWKDIYNGREIDFHEFYFYGLEPVGEANSSYFTSPYYQESVEGASVVTAQNFFQDALEYATYLFVLGYDYVDENGQATEYAPYFDFDIETVENASDPNYGQITDIKVGGWKNEKISVSKKQADGGESALGRVKKLYNALGSYVGLTNSEDENGIVEDGEEGNVQQIERFIKDKVIGQAAWGTGDEEGGRFEVKIFENGTQQDSLFFNRNYEQIVHNVVKYACTKAPIGDAEGSEVNLDSPYPASDITDFKGNYFEAHINGDLDATGDEDMFGHIDAAEYQSIIFMPKADDIDLNDPLLLSDIFLYFEYNPTSTTKKAADSITINVGFRYFDHDAGEKGEYISSEPVQKVIKRGKFPDAKDYSLEDYGAAFDSHTVQFSDSKTGGDGITLFDQNDSHKELQIKTAFKCPPEIDAFADMNNLVDGTDGRVSRMRINGVSGAKDFYKLNKSSSYGFFGTLNPEKFAGPNGCDFIEIYFDIVKLQGLQGAEEAAEYDYSFKVCTEFVTFKQSEKI